MTVTAPGPTLGVVGGGQLGRMLAEAAAPLGVDVVVLDPTPDCPAARVAEQIQGEFDDPDAVRTLTDRADALTIEIELADPELLEQAAVEADVPVHTSPDTLRTIQDKLVQNRALADAGIPVPEFRRVDDRDDLRTAIEAFDGVMSKARTGGYDGRGNAPARTTDDVDRTLAALGREKAADRGEADVVAEEFVDFVRELSVIGVKGENEVRTFPATETIHEQEILRETVVPARTDPEVRERARAVARDVLAVLDGRGVYGIELFETVDGEILVNEIAPRPHNSGHWTIEGADASQFEQHVRAVLGWPLAPAETRCPTAITNVLGDVDEPRPATLHGVDAVLETPGAHLHWYGKREVRPLRKMGHVTVVPADEGSTAGDRTDQEVATGEDLLETARELGDRLTFVDGEEEDDD